jgi:hypothetical protein
VRRLCFGMNVVFVLITISAASRTRAETAQSNAATIPMTLESFDVQCGVLSDEGLPEGAKPRFTVSACKLFVTLSDSGVTRFEFIGTDQGRKITWTFEGDARLNVFKQLAPQTGGKFNRSVQNGLACFVGFDDEGLDDPTSTICYRRSTLRKIIGWDRKSGSKYPLL